MTFLNKMVSMWNIRVNLKDWFDNLIFSKSLPAEFEPYLL